MALSNRPIPLTHSPKVHLLPSGSGQHEELEYLGRNTSGLSLNNANLKKERNIGIVG